MLGTHAEHENALQQVVWDAGFREVSHGPLMHGLLVGVVARREQRDSAVGMAVDDVPAQSDGHERGHGHSHGAVDPRLLSTAQGLSAVKWSLVILGLTAAAQIVIVVFSGSVALLADTVHNVGDALTAVPLVDRLRAGPASADEALHLRLRPSRGPCRHRSRARHPLQRPVRRV